MATSEQVSDRVSGRGGVFASGRLFFSAFALVTLDQALKHWVEGRMPLLKRAAVLGQDLVVITRTHNRGLMGARFSALPEGVIETYTVYLPFLSWVLLGALVTFRWGVASAGERFSGLLLLAAGGSNLFEHAFRGRVVDTFGLWIGGASYLPFNLADISILVGAAGVAWGILSSPARSERPVGLTA